MIAAWLPTVSPLPSINTVHVGFVSEGDTIHMAYRDGAAVKYIRSDNEGHTWGSSVTVVASGVDEVPLTQCIACNGETVHVAYLKDSGDVGTPPSLYYRRSTDGGDTWSSEVTFDPGTGDAFPSTARISLVAVGDYAHCFWCTGAKELRYNRSTDDGANWSAYTVVDVAAVAERPEAQLDGTNIHLTWTDLRHGTLSNGGETYYMKSMDRGVTWLTSQRITNTSFNTARPTVAATGNRVVLAWQWPIFGEDITWTFSDDGGSTWAAEQTMTNPAEGNEHASLQYANEVFAVAYTNLGTGISWVQLSRDYGETWETAQQPYTPAGAAQAPLLQFTTRFLVMMDRDNITNGTKIVRSPVFESEPSIAALRDDFNRADDATPPPGVNWTNGITTFVANEGIAIVSNAACRKSTGGYRQGGYWNANMFTDVDAVVDMSGWADTSNNGFAIFGRLVQIADNTTDGYVIEINRGANTAWLLRRITNEVGTNLVSQVNRNIAANDRFALSCRGNLIMAWHQPGGTGEWTQVAAAVDTTYASQGRVGLEFLNNQVTRATNLWATEVRTLNAEPGGYSVSGNTASLDKSFPIAANPGTYTVTGVAATFVTAPQVSANPGSCAITGSSATLAKGSVVPADTPFYTVAGTDAELVSGRAINAAPAAYNVTGAAAQLVFTTAGAFLIDAQDGTYTVTGADANLVLTLLYIDAQPGAFAVTGENATLDPDTQGEVLYEAGEQGQIADYGRGRIRELVGRLS